MSCCSGSLYFPATLQAGLALAVEIVLEHHPAPEWRAEWLLRGPKSINVSASSNENAHIFAVSAEETAKWAPGRYWYSLRVSRAQSIVEIESGTLDVEADFANAPDGYDGRSKFEIALDALDAVIAKRATQDQLRYRINNRELWRTPIADLLKLRAYYATKVQQECARRNGRRTFGRSITVRFTS